ncbi:MAG: hypothetical protein LBU00_01840 [Treponema sp.]|jgi:hypothetical protein|nr:hypothetical protein [Treponema sp.]
MMDFLDAECVINALVDKGVFARKVWKLNKVTANSYDVIFELADSARCAGFTIFIKGTYHCVGVTALRNHSRRFGISADDLLSRCALPE